jgi:hypothetical protein
MSRDEQMLRAALKYAEDLGFATFPCKPRGKTPLTNHGCKDATCDPVQIRRSWQRWPDANLGIATGTISGIVVLDVDPRHGGDCTLEALMSEHGKLPETPTVLTGGGGFHFYFRHPGGIVSNSGGKVGAGIDVRGDGGYVIAPRSVHESGNRYLWEVSSRIDDIPLAELPAWLLKLIIGTEARGVSDIKRFEPPPVFQDGARNEYLYRTARSTHAKYSLSADEILNLLHGINRARCKPPVDQSELAKIAHNAATQADRPDFKPGTVDPDVERLAKLSALEYDKVRKGEAKKLGVRVDTLDAAVNKARPHDSSVSESLAPPAPELWPEPVDGRVLLNTLRAFLARFIFVNTSALVALTLWVCFSYLLDVAEISPRLAITSPTKRCGKTALLDVLSWLIFRPIASSNLSPAALFRTIDLEQCSLLLDEADAMPRKSERTEEIRGLLNSGHTRTSAYAIRAVKSGDDWIPKKFSTWAAIAVAAIGQLPDTWADRSVAISLTRKPRSIKVERLIRRNTQARAEANEMTRKIARWAVDRKEELANAMPDLPPELDDRAANNWEMLLAIADLAGGEWPEEARQAAVTLSGERSESGSIGEQLLERLHRLFRERQADRLPSAEICEFLTGLEGEPWREYGRHEKPITQNQVARLLKRFHVAPRTIRVGDQTPKGYLLADLEKVFDVYVAPQTATAPHPNEENDSSEDRTATAEKDVAADLNGFAHGENSCGGVADENAENEKELEI